MRTSPILAFLACVAFTAAPAHATTSTYGTGCHDTGGAIPAFALNGNTIPGGLVNLSVTGGQPLSTFFIFIGLNQAQLPVGYGCDLLVSPLLAVVGPLPLDGTGALALPVVLPTNVVTPATVTLQVFAVDGTTQLGASTSNGVSLTIDAPPAPVGLVINEVEYDQTGTDFDEFVEIYNPTSSAISLLQKSLVLVNGSNNATYTVVDLSPAVSLAAGQYLVVGNVSVVVPAGQLSINFATASNSIQNGAPDGIALVDNATGMLLDALSYEGAMTMAVVTGVVGTVSLVEGTATSLFDVPSPGSMSRFPNGTDSNDASVDWIVSSADTPGAANVP